MEVSSYVDKLNKVDGNIYVIEEEVHLTDGVYEAELAHDNINVTTFSVHTGPKLTGTRIETYALSTPSMTPWKKRIKVFSKEPKVYISYETEGDTVEADDINRVQQGIVDTQAALNTEGARALKAEQRLDADLKAEATRAKSSEKLLTDNLSTEASRAKAKEAELQGNINAHTSAVAGEMQSLRAADLNLESKKANVVYVNSELAKRYTKEQVYTKEEVLWQIEELIGSAPETLNSLKEIADALGNDPNFAGTIMNALAGKVDKEAGKQLSTNDYSDSEKGIVEDVNAKKHIHLNKTILDKLTQPMLDNLSSAFSHISDAIKHITETERTNWNDAYNKRHGHGNKAVIDKLTQALLDKLDGVEDGANQYIHPTSSGNRHIPSGGVSGQFLKWSANGTAVWAVDNNTTYGVATTSTNGLMAGADKAKLDGIASDAEVNVQSDWNITDSASDAFIKNKPVSLPASDVSAWAKAATKPTYSWSEVTSKPTSFTPAAHMHTKSQVTDMPTKVSQFENDKGYLTSVDVDTSQNHTHSNKTVLDKIAQTLLDNWNNAVTHVSDAVKHITATERTNWNAAYSHVSNKSNPHGVTASQVGAATTAHTHAELVATVSSANTSSTSANMYSKLATMKITSRYGYISRTYEAIIGSHGHTNSDYLRLNLWFKQQNAFGEAPYVYISVMQNDSTIERVQFYAVIDELNAAYTQISLYVKVISGYTTCSLFTLSKVNLSGSITYINSSAFVSALPAGTVISQVDASGSHKHTKLQITDFPASLPANGGNAATVNGLTVATAVPSEAKFTDTVYSHPNSGATAGTYRSVTVNAQGHITGGTNPTTLAGNGITDAAAKSHNHDTVYLKKGAVVWGDLKGV